jgi:hypothetical protein
MSVYVELALVSVAVIAFAVLPSLFFCLLTFQCCL